MRRKEEAGEVLIGDTQECEERLHQMAGAKLWGGCRYVLRKVPANTTRPDPVMCWYYRPDLIQRGSTQEWTYIPEGDFWEKGLFQVSEEKS